MEEPTPTNDNDGPVAGWATPARPGPATRLWRTRAFVRPLLVTIVGIGVTVALSGLGSWGTDPGGAASDFILGIVTGLAVGLSSRGVKVGVQAMAVGIVAAAGGMAVTKGLSMGFGDHVDMQGIVFVLVEWGLIVVLLLFPIGIGFAVGILVRTLIRPNEEDR